MDQNNKYNNNEMVWNTARITKIWQRHEVSQCYRENGASVLAWHSVAINVHFFKALSVKHSKTSGPIFQSVLIHKSTHIRTQVRTDLWECVYVPMLSAPPKLIHLCKWNICKVWANGLRYVGAPRAVHDHRTVSSKLQQRKLKNQGTSLAVQQLRFCASTAGGMDSIPGQVTKIPHAAWPQTPQKKNATQRKPDSDYS